MWYVYFLELNNADIYVGSTNDLKCGFGLIFAERLTSVNGSERQLRAHARAMVSV